MFKITYFCAYQYLKLENIFLISNPWYKKVTLTLGLALVVTWLEEGKKKGMQHRSKAIKF